MKIALWLVGLALGVILLSQLAGEQVLLVVLAVIALGMLRGLKWLMGDR